MSAPHAEVLEALRSIDVPEDKAIKAATALSSSLGKVEDDAAKGLARRGADIEGISKDGQALEVDAAVLKWMAGFDLAIGIAVLFGH